MDKILKFINSKTNNKYKDLLFFGGFYDTNISTMQLEFGSSNKEIVNDAEKKEILVLCKEFLKEYSNNIVVNFKSSVLSMQELKDYVIKLILKNDALSFINTNQIVFDFSGDYINAKIPFDAEIENDVLQDEKNEIENQIFEETKYKVNLIFESHKINERVLQARAQKLEEDCKLSQMLLLAEIVDISDLKIIYGTNFSKQALLAGNFDSNGQPLFVVGKVKSCYVREFVPKRQKKQDDIAEVENTAEQQNTKKFLSFELEYDGNSVNCSWFFPKQFKDIEPFKVGESIVVGGDINLYHNKQSIKVNSLAYCTFVEPPPVWRECPQNYMLVFPEKYEFELQTNLFAQTIETSCQFLKDNDFVVYDLETTGINREICKIIDIGAYKVRNGKIIEKFCTFVNPECHIPAEASSINHITNNLVENSPTIEEVLPDFYKFCHDATMVGYNSIGFDDIFVNREGKRYHYNFDNKRFDVFDLAKQKLPGLRNYKLCTVCESENVPLIDAHRATNDALATAKLFIELAEKYC